MCLMKLKIWLIKNLGAISSRHFVKAKLQFNSFCQAKILFLLLFVEKKALRHLSLSFELDQLEKPFTSRSFPYTKDGANKNTYNFYKDIHNFYKDTYRFTYNYSHFLTLSKPLLKKAVRPLNPFSRRTFHSKLTHIIIKLWSSICTCAHTWRRKQYTPCLRFP